MIAAPLPADEMERLNALRSYDVLDKECDAAFSDITALVARVTDSPTSLISLVDANRQWFLARHNFEISETPRDVALCSHAILHPTEPLIVPDTTRDARFDDNPMVTGYPNIRAYLGVPLVNPEGLALGILCVIDYKPREFDAGAVASLQTLARAVVANLELRRSLHRSNNMALVDALTELPNRRAVMDRLASLVTADIPVTVIAIDLDHFKEINDAEGHGAGDAVLRAAANRLRAAVRQGDVVGRMGGDEFTVLLPGVGDRKMADTIAQRIRADLHQPVEYGTRLLRPGATLGVATFPADVAEPDMVMRAADEALIRCKQDGRGRIAYACRTDAAEMQRSTAIVRAFEADGAATATAYFQPIIAIQGASAAGAKVVSLEVLTRWSHPTLGNVPPDKLFATIGPQRAAQLSEAVRQQALGVFAGLQDRLTNTRLALNLSACEVMQPDVSMRIVEQVDQAGLSLPSIELEITEEVLLDRVSDRTLDQLAALRGRGARLVLDDFGTGNSGLSQILRLPLDGLKLDKRFVRRLGNDKRAEEIVRATVSLAHSLGLEVVAEGVETERQMAMVRMLGCDTMQGYLFARPMTPEALESWLDENGSVNVAAFPLQFRKSSAGG